MAVFEILLRGPTGKDLAVFFEQQRDPVAVHMAAFTAKDPNDRQAFDAHWDKVLADRFIIIQTIVVNGQVAGYVLCHGWFGDPEISYWLGREFWGKGIATRALEQFLGKVEIRPLYGRAARDNLASIRVMEKCGFKQIGDERGFANARGEEIDEVILELV